MATYSSALAWRIPGMGEPGGLPSMGSHRVGHDWSDLAAAAAGKSYHLSEPWVSQLWNTEKHPGCQKCNNAQRRGLESVLHGAQHSQGFHALAATCGAGLGMRHRKNWQWWPDQAPKNERMSGTQGVFLEFPRFTRSQTYWGAHWLEEGSLDVLGRHLGPPLQVSR